MTLHLLVLNCISHGFATFGRSRTVLEVLKRSLIARFGPTDIRNIITKANVP